MAADLELLQLLLVLLLWDLRAELCKGLQRRMVSVWGSMLLPLLQLILLQEDERLKVRRCWSGSSGGHCFKTRWTLRAGESSKTSKSGQTRLCGQGQEKEQRKESKGGVDRMRIYLIGHQTERTTAFLLSTDSATTRRSMACRL